jgi:proteasome lid subunit RPN8/RPN11
MSFHLLLPRQIYEQMIQQAQSELPNECCGLLAARIGVRGQGSGVRENRVDGEASEANTSVVIRIERCYPLINDTASPREYESSPRSMFDAVRDMRRQGLDIIATYHSHPSSPPIPSRTDLARNYSEDVVNFIISLQKVEPQVRAWWLTATDYREATWEITDTTLEQNDSLAHAE